MYVMYVNVLMYMQIHQTESSPEDLLCLTEAYFVLAGSLAPLSTLVSAEITLRLLHLWRKIKLLPPLPAPLFMVLTVVKKWKCDQ